jgi:hypothetical protein
VIDRKTRLPRRRNRFLGEPFKHDLFVSYSHGAFAGNHDADQKLWSQRLAEDLRKELAGTAEFENISVFLDEADRPDENVPRTEQLTGLLRDRVAGSALFTLLMSPHYLRSKWCRQELDWWCEKHHPDTFGAGGRIYICRVRPSNEGTWPEPLKDIAGYFCYDRDKDPDRARPFTWRGSQRDLDDYNDLLVHLTGDIMQRLRAMSAALAQRREREKAAANLAADGGQVIYLHAREAHAKAWERASDTLEQNGFLVTPAEPDSIAREPKAIREIAERRVETMSGCDGVLLLGTKDGRALDADLVVVGRQDCNSARAITDRLLPCGVLNTAGAVVATARRRAMARALGIHWIDAGRDLWPGELKSWLIGASAAMELA